MPRSPLIASACSCFQELARRNPALVQRLVGADEERVQAMIAVLAARLGIRTHRRRLGAGQAALAQRFEQGRLPLTQGVPTRRDVRVGRQHHHDEGGTI